MTHPVRWIAAAAITAALSSPTAAHAQMLQDCTIGLGNGRLPIGYPTDQEYWWKADLVDWMDNFQTADFKWSPHPQFIDPQQAFGQPAGPCQSNAPWAALGPAEQLQVEQYWMLLKDNEFIAPMQWFAQNAADYTVDVMEDNFTCNVLTPDHAWGDRLAFFFNWQYPGNPFRPGTYNHEVLQRRLGVWLAEQLILIDRGHHGGPAPWPAGHPAPSPYTPIGVGSELAAALGTMSWTYIQIKPSLPANVQKDIEAALSLYAERAHQWGVFNQHSNRGIRATHAFYYTWLATQDPAVWAYYQTSLWQFFHPSGGNWVPGGYWRDDRGMDLNYGGSNLMSAVRTMQIDPNTPAYVRSAVEDAFELNAHLTVPDVDGRWLTPNVFNSRTNQGPTRILAPHAYESYYGDLNRYFAALDLKLPYAEAYLREQPHLGPNIGPAYNVQSPTFHEKLACDAQYGVFINAGLNTSSLPTTIWPALMVSQDWGPPPSTLQHHRTSLFTDWWDDVQQSQAPGNAHNANLELMPTEYDGPYLRSFADKFVFAKFGRAGGGREYSTMLHTGEIGFLNSGEESGWGGGQIVDFWSPQGGSFILGRREGRNIGGAADDEWFDWRLFPWHTVTMLTTNHELATSARILTPQTDVFMLAQAPNAGDTLAALAGTGAWSSPPTVPEANATAALVRVEGEIGEDGKDEATGVPLTNVLSAPVTYSRSFLLSADDVFVRTAVGGSAPTDEMIEAWETIPLWNRGVVDQPDLADARILIAADAGMVDGTYGTPGVVERVRSVQVHRADGVMRILFDRPRTVWIADVWESGQLRSRTLLVDLLPQGCGGACALPAGDFVYRIESLPLGTGDGEEGGGGDPGTERTAPPDRTPTADLRR